MTQSLDDSYWLSRISTDRNPLTDLEPKIAAHWRKYRPHLSARLAAAGEFDEAMREAAASARAETDRLMEDGLPLSQAWEIASESAFPPDEATEVELNAASAAEIDPIAAYINGQGSDDAEEADSSDKPFTPHPDTLLFPPEEDKKL